MFEDLAVKLIARLDLSKELKVSLAETDSANVADELRMELVNLAKIDLQCLGEKWNSLREYVRLSDGLHQTNTNTNTMKALFGDLDKLLSLLTKRDADLAQRELYITELTRRIEDLEAGPVRDADI